MTSGSLLVACLIIPLAVASYIESVAANVDGSRTHEKFVPLVAFECGFRNKYIDESGVWVTDENRYATCQSGKLDILKYCKKAYPKMNITNIVEYSHEVEINRWCREEGSPCKWSHVVRPFQCIDGEFRSEALQVPHDCRFSHVNSRDSCNDYQHWREESKKICSTKMFEGKKMSMRSFAVLEPCGLDLFTGVEFVCCPSNGASKETVEKSVSAVESRKVIAKTLPMEDEDDSDEDYTESDEDEDDDSSEGQDQYFKKVDPATEHESFRDAMDRLEKKHRSKIDVVMKEWSELEARYTEMKHKDPKGADKFKVSMTNRFQKTVASLEEEHKEAKKELEQVHEDRVQSNLNEKKRTATHDYRQALALHVSTPNKPNVLKSLKTYIRTEEKDRMHTLNKYRHLLRTDANEAKTYKETVLHKLRYIDLRINGTLAMLRDFPDLERQVRPIALAYWSDFRRENTPDLSDTEIDSLNTLDADAKNKKLVDLYQEAYEKLHPSVKLNVRAPPTTKRVLETTTAPSKILSSDSSDSEEDDDEYYEDEDDEETKKTQQKQKILDIKFEKEDFIEPRLVKVDKSKAVKELEKEDDLFDSDSDSDEYEDDDQMKELRVDIEPIIEEKPSFYKQERLMQHQRNIDSNSRVASSQALFIFGAVFMVAATLMVVSMIRRRRSHQGFIEVDVYTPEERHVAGMQVNGYENPTYSFFDSKA